MSDPWKNDKRTPSGYFGQKQQDRRCRCCGVAMPDAALREPMCDDCFCKAETRDMWLGCLWQILLLAGIAGIVILLFMGLSWFADTFFDAMSGQSAFVIKITVAAMIAALALLCCLCGFILTERFDHRENSLAVKCFLTAGLMLFSFAGMTAFTAVLGLIIP